jgi:hypothetical protein
MVVCEVVGYVECLNWKESVWEGELGLGWSIGKVRGEGEEEISPAPHGTRCAFGWGRRHVEDYCVFI